MASKLGLSNKTISKYETGRSMPDYAIITNLCQVLDITIGELINGQEDGDNTKDQLMDLLKRIQELEKQKDMLLGIVILVMAMFLMTLSYSFSDSNFSDFISGALLGIAVVSIFVSVLIIIKNIIQNNLFDCFDLLSR
ncbi:helix-turn-helix domain-containing protein [uncultured Thomasclavelia sp.]|uniref:helix-turn-helix domain-containing protein n=1 Tax=uncultured Thomasclavelia sp. TaxID=3025759 RepID=UPI0035A64B87